MENEIFVAFSVDWDKGTYEIYLVNPTGESYSKTLTYTGAFCSDDDGVIETSRSVKDKGELRPYSFIKLEDDTVDQLDFVIWYWVDLYRQSADSEVVRMAFSVPKYGYATCYEERSRYLPIIEKACPCLEVEPRASSLEIYKQAATDKMDKRIPFVFGTE